MRRNLVFILLAFSMFFIGCQKKNVVLTPINYRAAAEEIKLPNRINREPQQLGERVSYLVENKDSAPKEISWESPENGHLWYHVRAFGDGGAVYEIEYRVYRKGTKSLEINHYLTNRDFGRTADDIVADELMSGRAEIHQEVHMLDHFYNESVLDMFQMFSKRRGPVWMGFTREERDLGKKAGVKEYLYMNRKVLQERRFGRVRWAPASEEEKDRLESVYIEHLLTLISILK